MENRSAGKIGYDVFARHPRNRRACFQLALFKLASRRLALSNMSTTRAVWLFVAALTAIHFRFWERQISPLKRILGCGRSDWRQPTSAKDLVSLLPYARAPLLFWRERVWCSLLQHPCTRSGYKSAPVLFCAPFVRRHRWSVDSHRLECHTDFQHRRDRDDDRRAIDFFLDGGHVYFLARGGKPRTLSS